MSRIGSVESANRIARFLYSLPNRDSLVMEDSRTSPSRSPRFINDLGLRAPDPVLKDIEFACGSECDDDSDDPRE